MAVVRSSDQCAYARFSSAKYCQSFTSIVMIKSALSTSGSYSLEEDALKLFIHRDACQMESTATYIFIDNGLMLAVGNEHAYLLQAVEGCLYCIDSLPAFDWQSIQTK